MLRPDRKTWQEHEPCGAWFLWRAVLHLALFDLSNSTRKDDALEWILSDAEHTGSALWVCEQLGLDVKAVRQRAKLVYDGRAQLTTGDTRRTWARRTGREEPYRKTVNEN